MGGAGGAAGVLLGGVLTDALGWRWILFINVPIGLVAAVLTYRYIAEGRNRERAKNFDLAGAVTATIGLSLLVLGIVRTDVTGWGAAQTLALIGAGVLLLLLFVAIEGRFATAPLMPLRIYASHTLSVANVVVLMIGAATFGMWFFVSLYLQQVLGYSPIKAGLAFLPMTLCIVAGSTLASRAVIRVGTKPLLVAGLISETIGLLLFATLSADGTYINRRGLSARGTVRPHAFRWRGLSGWPLPRFAPTKRSAADGTPRITRLVIGAHRSRAYKPLSWAKHDHGRQAVAHPCLPPSWPRRSSSPHAAGTTRATPPRESRSPKPPSPPPRRRSHRARQVERSELAISRKASSPTRRPDS
jgi:MFS family permease